MRDRLSVIVAIAVAVLAVGSTSVAETSRASVEATVDANWRGAYDILVLPKATGLNLGSTSDLVEPNFLGFGGRGGITFDDAESIAAMPGVEFAAPIAVVGHVGYALAAPTVHISETVLSPTLYEFTLTEFTNDGTRDFVLQRQRYRIIIGPADLGGDESPVVTDAPYVSWSASGVDVALWPIIRLTSQLIAVDPAAERGLLGATGAFLEPLGEAGGGDTPETVSTFDPTTIHPAYPRAVRDIVDLAGFNEITGTRPVVPISVSSRVYAPLRLGLDVTQIGRPLISLPPAGPVSERLAAAEAAAGDGASFLGRETVDYSDDLRPLSPPALTLIWPGSEPGDSSSTITTTQEFDTSVLGRPTYSARESLDDKPTFTVSPKGLVVAGRVEPAGSESLGVTVFEQQSYRSREVIPLPLADDFVRQIDFDAPFVFAPVSEFDLSTVDLAEEALSYVPIGAYDPPKTTLVADASGEPVTPDPILPTLNSVGLLTPPPLAITNMSSARLLRGDAAIDAIRVRVRGLTDFGPDARSKVASIAERIESLGVTAIAVAGSSPRPVNVYVPAYDASTQPPADLGYVQQPWTTLGAAGRVERALTEAASVLLLMSALTGVTLIAGLQSLRQGRRVGEAAVLRELGWSRRAVVRWFLAESVVAAAIVWVAASATALAMQRPTVGFLVAIALGLLMPLATLMAVVTNDSTTARSHRVRRGRRIWPLVGEVASSGPRTLALRGVMAQPTRNLIVIATAAGALSALSVGLAATLALADTSGETRLAEATRQLTQPAALVILGLAIVAGAAFWVFAAAAEMRDRQADYAILRGSGWRMREIGAVAASHAAFLSIATGLTGILMSGAIAVALGLSAATAIAVAAITAACLGTATVMSIYRVAARRPREYVGQ